MAEAAEEAENFVPDIVELLHGRPERFILFTDDLSFEDGEPAYKALKSVLDGSLAAVPDNVLIYATSNRRHLMPEYFDGIPYFRDEDGPMMMMEEDGDYYYDNGMYQF